MLEAWLFITALLLSPQVSWAHYCASLGLSFYVVCVHVFVHSPVHILFIEQYLLIAASLTK